MKETKIGKPRRTGYEGKFGARFSAFILRSILAWLVLLAGAPAWAQGAAASLLEEATDLPADAQLAAARGAPLVLLYSRDGCHWCERVRREYLGPMVRDPATQAVIREVHMDRNTALIDFQGRRTTSADFSRTMKARFAPTVMFHGPDGRLLAESLVGFLLADFYGGYLERAIDDSKQKLRSEKAQ